MESRTSEGSRYCAVSMQTPNCLESILEFVFGVTAQSQAGKQDTQTLNPKPWNEAWNLATPGGCEMTGPGDYLGVSTEVS